MASQSGNTPSGDGGGTQQKSSRLDIVLKKLQTSAADSRESSPDVSSKEVQQRSGSSRRKPAVIRKFVESEEDSREAYLQDTEDGPQRAAEFEGTGSPQPSTSGVESPIPGSSFQNGQDDQDTINIDEHGNYILPEGTVVVQPEEVVEKHPQFRGPEFQHRKRAAGELDIVMCTACNKQINPNNNGTVRRHPVLKVLICKKCYNWYTSDEIDQDSDGMDEQCRWCGEGGNLICCDFCHNAFCKGCIKRNLGRTELTNILESGDDQKWHCYVCDPKPLSGLIGSYEKIIEAIQAVKKQKHDIKEKREPKREKEIETRRRSLGSAKPANPPKRSDVAKKQTSAVNPRSKGARDEQGSQSLIKQMFSMPQFQKVLSAGQTLKNTPKLKVSPDMDGGDIPINATNVSLVLDRMVAATQSMSMLLASLKDDLTGRGHHRHQKDPMTMRVEVAKKLKRAMTSFKKSFRDIEDMARNYKPPKSEVFSPVGPVYKHGRPAVNVKKGGLNMGSIVHILTADGQRVPVLLNSPGNPVGQQKTNLQVKPKKTPKVEEVIELLDSSEDENSQELPPKEEKGKHLASESQKENQVKSQKPDEEKENKKKFTLRLSLDGAKKTVSKDSAGESDSQESNCSANCDAKKENDVSGKGKESGKKKTDNLKNVKDAVPSGSSQTSSDAESAKSDPVKKKTADSGDGGEKKPATPSKEACENRSKKASKHTTEEGRTDSGNVAEDDGEEGMEVEDSHEKEGNGPGEASGADQEEVEMKDEGKNQAEECQEETAPEDAESENVSSMLVAEEANKNGTNNNLTNGGDIHNDTTLLQNGDMSDDDVDGEIIQLDGPRHHSTGSEDSESEALQARRSPRRMKQTERKTRGSGDGKELRSSKRSRADIEAQRMLHKELLDEESDEESEDPEIEEMDLFETSDSEEKVKSSGEEYDPDEDKWKNRRRRTEKQSESRIEKLEAYRQQRRKDLKRKRHLSHRDSDDSMKGTKKSPKRHRAGSSSGKKSKKDSDSSDDEDTHKKTKGVSQKKSAYSDTTDSGSDTAKKSPRSRARRSLKLDSPKSKSKKVKKDTSDMDSETKKKKVPTATLR